MQFTLPLAFLAMVLCLLLILRSLLFMAIVITVVGLSIAMALGLAVRFGIEFSPIVGMAPAMILTLAVADCIHVLSTYRHERLVGHDTRAAMHGEPASEFSAGMADQSYHSDWLCHSQFL
jgi:uncharacterized protein